MIPKPAPKEQRQKIRVRSVLIVAGLTILTAVVGIIVGTHPAFNPENFPSSDEIKIKFRKLPIISALFEAKIVQEGQPQDTRAWLTINLKGYQPGPSHWAILCVLDNSTSMLKDDESGTPSRYSVGLTLLNSLARDTSAGSKFAVRDFGAALQLKRKGRTLKYQALFISTPLLLENNELLASSDTSSLS